MIIILRTFLIFIKNSMFYKVVTPLSFLSKQDTRNLNSSTTQTSNTNNLQSYNKSANINNNNEQKNEIIVKSIKILAVTEDEVNDYSSSNNLAKESFS